MRLPTLNREHEIHEAARARNEALYEAFLTDQRVTVPTTPETVDQMQVKASSDCRRFWRSRGFRIRTKRIEDSSQLLVWLERIPTQTAAA